MRKHLSLFLVLLGFVFILSCSSSSKSGNDADVLPDADSDGSDAETINDDSDSQDADIIDDKDQSDDSDSESSVPSQEEPDDDFGCPIVEGDQDYEKLWLTDDDPYADRENFLYKYYGNYDVVADDPEQVRATLWKYHFSSYNGCRIYNQCSKYDIHPYEACADNYPFEPILIEDYPNQDDTVVKNENILKNKCDGLMTPEKRWQNDWIYGRNSEYFAKNGKVVFIMKSYYAPGVVGTFVFDIPTRQLIKIGDGAANLDFNGKLVLMSTYNKSINDDSPDLPGYQMPVQELIYYDIEKHKYGYAWYGEKFYGINYLGLGDTYAMMSYQTKPNDSGEMKVVYTKIGDWKNWKELKKFTTGDAGFVIARYPHLAGSQVVFQNYDIATIFCDLEKGDDGCVKVSLEEELTYFPKIIGDRKIIYHAVTYEQESKLEKIILVELNKDGSVKSRDVLIHDDRINAIRDVNNDFLLYSIKIGETENEHPISAPCYYRFSDKKTVCLDSDEDAVFTKHYSYIPGYGRYLIYQHYFDYVLRDMECYCDYHPDRCPYSDYTPNPDNPKVPVWRKQGE